MPAVHSKPLYVWRADYQGNPVLDEAQTAQPIGQYVDVGVDAEGLYGDFHAWLVWNGQDIDLTPRPEWLTHDEADNKRCVYIPWNDPTINEWLQSNREKRTAPPNWKVLFGFCYWNCETQRYVTLGQKCCVHPQLARCRSSPWRGKPRPASARN